MSGAAVLGHPVAHSLSPVLHRAAYSALGLDWDYGLHDVTEDRPRRLHRGPRRHLGRALAHDAAQGGRDPAARRRRPRRPRHGRGQHRRARPRTAGTAGTPMSTGSSPPWTSREPQPPPARFWGPGPPPARRSPPSPAAAPPRWCWSRAARAPRRSSPPRRRSASAVEVLGWESVPDALEADCVVSTVPTGASTRSRRSWPPPAAARLPARRRLRPLAHAPGRGLGRRRRHGGLGPRHAPAPGRAPGRADDRR